MPNFGWQSQAGWGEETTFGTVATIAKFAEFERESVKLDIARIRVASIRGSRSRQKLQYVEGRRRVAGDVVFPFYAKGLGQWIKHAMGSVTSVQQGTTAAWLHTFALAEAPPVGLTLEIQKGDAQFHKFGGCRIAQLTFEAEINNILRMTATIVGQDETISATGATATYPTAASNEVLIFHQGVFRIGGAVRNIRRFRVVIDNMPFEDYALGSKSVRSLAPAGRDVSGEFLMAYDTASAYDAVTQYTAFRNMTAAVLEMKFTGMEIVATPQHFNDLDIDLPVVFYDGETPDTEGPEAEIELPVPFRAFKDTSDEIAIALKNVETSV